MKSNDASEYFDKPTLVKTCEGLSLCYGDSRITGNFEKMIPRLTHANLSHELSVKACKLKSADGPITIIDATAGMGEDALLLAAAGFNVIMFERDEMIASLLKDTMERAMTNEILKPIVSRMDLVVGDSIPVLKGMSETVEAGDIISVNATAGIIHPDVVFLDPMFPERQKTGLVKKKFQLIHTLEKPCEDEEELLNAAIMAHPKRIVIKRPLKGPYLAGVKPSYSLEGKAIRYDCIVL